jgi:hypothetical protein
MTSANTKRNPNAETNDLYSTPKAALDCFYNQYPEVFESYNTYYDPCNGLGDIADYLRSIGKVVITSDLIDYGLGDNIKDFLTLEEIDPEVDCIIMNPPYTLTGKFIDKALDLCNNVLMFNRTSTLESIYRGTKFESREWPLANYWQFSHRVSCTKGISRELTSNSVSYGWFELCRGFSGKTEMDWILKE